MRLSTLWLLVFSVLYAVGQSGCDIPIPTEGPASTGQLPDLTEATVLSGSLTDSDASRSNGSKEDEAARVVVPPGATLHVLLESQVFDPYLTVRVEGTTQSFSNDDWNGSRQQSFVSQRNSSTSPITAVILASAYGTTGRGAYTVKHLVVEPPPLPKARTLSLPATQTGTLTASTSRVPLLSNDAERPADVYAFSLAQGESATVRLESSEFDTYLKVLRDGLFLDRNDDFAGSRSVSQVTVTGPGQITVMAGAFSATANTGSYRLSITPEGSAAPAPAPSTDPTGTGLGSFQGEISASDGAVPLTANDDLRRADAYTVELRAGQTLVATMESTGFDTYLKLVRGSVFVARNDDAGSTRRSEIRQRIAVDGTYTVYAGTFTDAGRGAYTLSLRVE